MVATGYHHQFGHAHAEVDALNQLTTLEQARGATLYVTLEPCCHTGKTPPCVKRIVASGIKRVVIGQLDPNPLVGGNGVKFLQAHDVAVTICDYPMALNRAYNFFYRHQRPLITMKYAMSLDGKINQQTGQRTLLTGAAAWQDSQKLRTQQQAILIGEHTLLVDNPQLTVRQQELRFPPLRVVVVRDVNRLSPELALFKVPTPVWFLSQTPPRQALPPQVKVFVDAAWRPASIVAFLAQQGVQSVLIEGGSHLQAAFIAERLFDDLVIYVAPKILGGQGLPAIAGAILPQLLNLHQVKYQSVGADLRISAQREE